MNERMGLTGILRLQEDKILQDWLVTMQEDTSLGGSLGAQLQTQARGFLSAFSAAMQRSNDPQAGDREWDDVRALLENVSREQAAAGLNPAETATFVFSLKQPLFNALRESLAGQAERLGDEMWALSTSLDRLGLFTVEAHQRSREALIDRQQQELLDLSTPVVQLSEGILALPLIGTLDSERTQVIMESLLEAIVEHEATVAILDITGVPTVDTLVAQHLMKTVAAARLMGADCIISGIRPQIAQTIVHLGVDLGNVVTKATLAGALKVALLKTGQVIQRVSPTKPAA